MTISLNIASLAWAASAALFVARYLGPWADRWLSVHEARYAPRTHVEGMSAEPMPPDLLGLASAAQTGNAEMDSVMHEQLIAVLNEKYAELGSWDKVRMWSATNNLGGDIGDGWRTS